MLIFLFVLVFIGTGIFVLLSMKDTTVVENQPTYQASEELISAQPNSSRESPKEISPAVKLQILDTSVGYLNVREAPSLTSARIDRVRPGEVYEYTEEKDGWFHILFPDGKQGWVFGQYVQKIDRSKDLFRGM
ncbi:MAG: SH3 domain-containing protein [Patescibacteria group bacterium]